MNIRAHITATLAKLGGLPIATMNILAALSLHGIFAEGSSSAPLDNQSLDGLKEYRDNGDGIFRYYDSSAVPEAKDTRYIFGTYSWRYPHKGQMLPLTADIAYILNCKTGKITQVYEALHLNSAAVSLLPNEIQGKANVSLARKLIKTDGLRYSGPNKLLSYQDTTAFRMACGFDFDYSN